MFSDDERLSLCIINRDDSANLTRLIRTARPYVDQIVVVDTGSVDGSASAAIRAGADIVRAAPEMLESGDIVSFSRARQLSYDLATCPWQLWLDTDDDLSDWPALRDVVAEAQRRRDAGEPGVAAKMWYDYSWNDDRSVCTQTFTRDRITHRDDGWRWTRPVHEYLDRVGSKTFFDVPATLRVVHLSPGARGMTGDRNLKILRRWHLMGGAVEDPTALFYYLGDEMLARGLFREAVELFDRVPNLGDNFNWFMRSQFRAIRALVGARDWAGVQERCEKLIGENPIVADFRWELARALLLFGKREEAKEMLLSSRGCRMIPGENDQLPRLLVQALQHTSQLTDPRESLENSLACGL